MGRLFSWKFLPLVFVGFLAVAVAWADKCWADTARVAAGTIHNRYGGRKDTVLFAGHWGFQYYMESHGFRALDLNRTRLAPGDVLILPQHNCNVPVLPPELFSETASLDLVLCPHLTTMRHPLAAAFYGTSWGLLPFAVGSVSPERYNVMTTTHACEVSPVIGQ